MNSHFVKTQWKSIWISFIVVWLLAFFWKMVKNWKKSNVSIQQTRQSRIKWKLVPARLIISPLFKPWNCNLQARICLTHSSKVRDPLWEERAIVAKLRFFCVSVYVIVHFVLNIFMPWLIVYILCNWFYKVLLWFISGIDIILWPRFKKIMILLTCSRYFAARLFLRFETGIQLLSLFWLPEVVLSKKM